MNITAEQALAPPKTFEERRYEQLRATALTRSIGNTAIHGYEKRRYDELTSALAEALRPEGLTSAIDTHYTFGVNSEHKIVADDGEPLDNMLVRGLRNDIKMASQDSFYAPFLPDRSRHELDELREQQAMATGATGFNTLVVLSPYSQEYDVSEEAHRKLIKAHQKPYYRRAMLRLSHWDGHKLHIMTRSIDNSSVELLKEVARQQYGYEYQAKDSTGMLGERIRLGISDNSWLNLPARTVETADAIMAERYGGQWHQGNRIDSVKDAQAFVESETAVLDSLLRAEREIAAACPNYETYRQAFDRQVYNHIALLEQRLLNGSNSYLEEIAGASQAAGDMARAEGKAYDMCGHVLEPGNESNNDQPSSFESLMRLVGKKVECPFCEKKVVVPASDLAEGKLYCKDCNLGIDVCTGEKFSKDVRNPQSRQGGFLALLSQELTQWNRDYDLKQAEKKARMADVKPAVQTA